MSLLAVLALIATLVIGSCSTSQTTDTAAGDNQKSITVTDIAGRQVTLNAPVQRMLLGEGRLLYLTAILDREKPFDRIVGWPNDLHLTDPDTYEKYKQKFPEIDNVRETGSLTAGTFSEETAIDLQPDVMILTKDNYKGAQEVGAIETMAKVGVPTVVVDFREDPLTATVPSIELLGKIMGREDNAADFVEFYNEQLDVVSDRVANISARPTTFFYTGAGLSDCCSTFGDKNLGKFVGYGGGTNLGSELLPGPTGKIAEEQVFASNPDNIIVTGSSWENQEEKREDVSYVDFGYDADPELARQQLEALGDEPGWTNLKSVQTRHFYGLWHQFYTSPYNFLAAQQIAKWQHSEAFADIDPAKNFQELHERFLPVDYSGVFWTEL